MQKELLEQFIKDGLSANKIAKETKKALTTIRYWLRKHGLTTRFLSFKDPLHSRTTSTGIITEKKCPVCELIKPADQFHYRKNGEGISPYCKTCSNAHTTYKQKAFKLKCIEYKGGECEFCGYSKCVDALEFHHRNPKEKDFHMAQASTRNFTESIMKELDKCSLLCSNCHKEEHHRLNESNRNTIIFRTDAGKWTSKIK